MSDVGSLNGYASSIPDEVLMQVGGDSELRTAMPLGAPTLVKTLNALKYEQKAEAPADLYRQADFITLHLPKTAETRGWLQGCLQGLCGAISRCSATLSRSAPRTSACPSCPTRCARSVSPQWLGRASAG